MALANIIADLPFSASKVLLFVIIVYFLCGLHRSAGAFWTYYLFNYTCFLCLQGLFRTLGVLCSNFESAFRLVVFFVPNLYAFGPSFFSNTSCFPSISYGGYMIPVARMKSWLSWIVNPLCSQKSDGSLTYLISDSTTLIRWLTVCLSTLTGPGI